MRVADPWEEDRIRLMVHTLRRVGLVSDTEAKLGSTWTMGRYGPAAGRLFRTWK